MIAVTVTTLTSLKRAQGQGLIFEAVIISGCGLRRSSGGKIKHLTPPRPGLPSSLLFSTERGFLFLKFHLRFILFFCPIVVSLAGISSITSSVLFCLINKLRRGRSILLQISDFLNILEMYLCPLSIIVHQHTFYFALLSLLSHSLDSKNSSSSAETFISLTNIKLASDCT